MLSSPCSPRQCRGSFITVLEAAWLLFDPVLSRSSPSRKCCHRAAIKGLAAAQVPTDWGRREARLLPHSLVHVGSPAGAGKLGGGGGTGRGVDWTRVGSRAHRIQISSPGLIHWQGSTWTCTSSADPSQLLGFLQGTEPTVYSSQTAPWEVVRALPLLCGVSVWLAGCFSPGQLLHCGIKNSEHGPV